MQDTGVRHSIFSTINEEGYLPHRCPDKSLKVYRRESDMPLEKGRKQMNDELPAPLETVGW